MDRLLSRCGLNPNLWTRDPGSYSGLAMRCAPGTHAAAMAMIQRLAPPPVAVLDVAAGSGAMLARLRDGGYCDLSAIELDIQKFRLAGVTPEPLDLNDDFSGGIDRRFGLIVAIEIIEHLDSPRHFLVELRKLLTDDGTLIFSTPNIAEWFGRIKFVLTGTLRYFDQAQYDFNHHVSPLPDLQARHLLREVGLELVERQTTGTFFGPLKRAVFSPVRLAFGVIGGKAAAGDVNLYAVRKTVPVRPRIGDWTPAESITGKSGSAES